MEAAPKSRIGVAVSNGSLCATNGLLEIFEDIDNYYSYCSFKWKLRNVCRAYLDANFIMLSQTF